MIQETVVLLGLSHAGKTTAGTLLAALLSCPFYDTDALIRLHTGVTPRELCRQGGISALHCAEAAALRTIHDRDSCSVIAAGGGVCDNHEAAALIAAIPQRVFLHAPESVLFERLTHDAQQTGCYPAFLQLLPVSQYTAARQLFSSLYIRRTEYYRTCCTLCIDTSGLTAEAVAERIANRLQGSLCRK